MKGAKAEPCAKISMRLSAAINITSGSSHHFFRTRRKCQSSENRESLLIGRSVLMWVV